MKPEYESGQNRPVKSQDVATQNQQNWYERPYEELIRDIRSALAQTRADHEAKEQPFDPVVWVGMQLTQSAVIASGDAQRNLQDTSLAWDAISRPYIQDPDYQKAVDAVLMNGTAQRRSSLAKLSPPAVKLVSAMADAVGVPYSPEHTAVELLTDQQKQLFRQIHTKIARDNGI